MPQITSILLCFNSFNAYIIEGIIIIISCLGALNLYLAQEKLPWYADSLLESKIFLFSSICFLIIILFFTIIIVFFRFKSIINLHCNCFSFYLSLICIFSSLFGLITDLFMYVLLMTNMKYYNLAIKSKKSLKDKKLVTDQEWTNTIISMILSSLIWIILLLLTMSDNLRIDLKINDSYNKYLKALEDAKKDNAPKDEVSKVLSGYKQEREKRKQIIGLSKDNTQADTENKKKTSKQKKKDNERIKDNDKEVRVIVDELKEEFTKSNIKNQLIKESNGKLMDGNNAK